MIPDTHRDLLERPLFTHLATIRPDGTPQVNPMWSMWDGELLWFSTTTTRRKYRNISAHPEVAASINDPDQPYRYIELRGVVERVDPDTTAEFFDRLAARYGLDYEPPLPDAPDRIAVGIRPTHVTYQ
jgi:PPOX class probable F420-dependent enzyme